MSGFVLRPGDDFYLTGTDGDRWWVVKAGTPEEEDSAKLLDITKHAAGVKPHSLKLQECSGTSTAPARYGQRMAIASTQAPLLLHPNGSKVDWVYRPDTTEACRTDVERWIFEPADSSVPKDAPICPGTFKSGGTLRAHRENNATPWIMQGWDSDEDSIWPWADNSKQSIRLDSRVHNDQRWFLWKTSGWQLQPETPKQAARCLPYTITEQRLPTSITDTSAPYTCSISLQPTSNGDSEYLCFCTDTGTGNQLFSTEEECKRAIQSGGNKPAPPKPKPEPGPEPGPEPKPKPKPKPEPEPEPEPEPKPEPNPKPEPGPEPPKPPKPNPNENKNGDNDNATDWRLVAAAIAVVVLVLLMVFLIFTRR